MTIHTIVAIAVGQAKEKVTMIQAKDARRLNIDELYKLSTWCSNQQASLWDDLDTQALLDLYHASAESGWDGLIAWCINACVEKDSESFSQVLQASPPILFDGCACQLAVLKAKNDTALRASETK